ncbi:hypothetical protein Spb1_40510 [Planctopirus ephydatiae]|uniref:Uncharacterized protein n=1 Tax=Planctopirus ephydatiae TaxID=2528019 RepID=A0A518GU50_9PLAN|nr:hypothetical protein Spb1_40510 [Planctopirus ephydatiae]
MYASSVPVEENDKTVRDESGDSGGKFAVARRESLIKMAILKTAGHGYYGSQGTLRNRQVHRGLIPSERSFSEQKFSTAR